MSLKVTMTENTERLRIPEATALSTGEYVQCSWNETRQGIFKVQHVICAITPELYAMSL